MNIMLKTVDVKFIKFKNKFYFSIFTSIEFSLNLKLLNTFIDLNSKNLFSINISFLSVYFFLFKN